MFSVDSNYCWKIREKRAREMLNLGDAAAEIGISRQTLRLIESGKKKEIRKTIYEKITTWLLNN